MAMQPQSDDEIRPIRLELQRMDLLLDLRWDPKAVMTAPGSYTALGQRTDAKYDGLWQVIRYDDPNTGHAGFHAERGFVSICHLTTWTRDNGVIRMLALRDGGAYVPVGEWVLELMRQADAANVCAFEEIRRRVWAENDRADRAEGAMNDAEAIAMLDEHHFDANYAGGVGNWQGKGADFTAMERAAASRTKDAVSRLLAPR